MPDWLIYALSGISYACITFVLELFARNIFNNGKNVKLKLIFLCSFMNGLIMCVLSVAHTRVSDMYIVYAALILLELLFCFKDDKEALLAGAVHISLNIVCTRNFSVCLLAIMYNIPLDNVLLNMQLRFASLIISIVLMLLIFMSLFIMVSREGLVQLLKHKKQLRILYTIGISLFFYQVYCTKALYYNINILWFSFLQLFGSALILIAYYFIFINSLRSSIMVNVVWKYKMLQRQIERQLTHYKAFDRSEQTIRIFKHDYKKLVSGVSKLLAAGQKEQALAVLEQMDYALQNNVKVHLRYSGIFSIDAVMQELANECENDDIKFNAVVPTTNDFPLSPLECSSLFTCMAKISSEECVADNSQNKFIFFKTSNNENWFTVTSEFSFHNTGARKLNEVQRGLEYFSICETAKKYGGFASIECENGCAKLSVHLSYDVKEGVSL